MAQLGGYLGVAYVSERVFQAALHAAWCRDWKRALYEIELITPTPLGYLDARGALSLEKPGILFSEADNAVVVRISGGLRLGVFLDNRLAGNLGITFDVSTALRFKVTQEHRFTKAAIDLSEFSIEEAQLKIGWHLGPHAEGATQAAIGAEARAQIAQEIRKRAARYLTFHLPTEQIAYAELAAATQGIPGSIVITPQIKLGNVKILDKWFALGIEATNDDGQTQGDARLIGPPPELPPPTSESMPQPAAGPATVRLIMDSVLLVEYLRVNAKFALRMAKGLNPDLHPDEDSVQVAVKDDGVFLEASGAVDVPDPFSGQMAFTAKIRIRPFVANDRSDIYLSVNPAVALLAPPPIPEMGRIRNLLGGDAFGKIRRLNKSEMPLLFTASVRVEAPRFDADNDSPKSNIFAVLKGRQIVMRPDLVGIWGEIDIEANNIDPGLSPMPGLSGSINIRDRHLFLRFAWRRMQIDPTFLVRYSVRRGSSHAEIAFGTVWSGLVKAFSQEVDMWDPANLMETNYVVETIAERPPGVEVARALTNIKVLDPFDRSHPFVRWQKMHYYTGRKEPIPISSAIHRTALPGRCKFCDVRNSRFGTPYLYEALDTLPPADRPGFSDRLCQYCFPDGEQ